jgi:hypothetical protein
LKKLFQYKATLIFIFVINVTLSQEPCGISNIAFQRGERIEYRVNYMWMHAGTAVLTVTDDQELFHGRKTFHVVGSGVSDGMFDWFFKVNDKYESYLDEENIIPYSFIRRVDEGGHKLEQDVTFNQNNNIALSKNRVYRVPSCVQDIFSAFYYSRCLNYDTLTIGEETEIVTFLDDELFPMKIKYYGDEIIKIPMGTFKCQKFKPLVQKGRVFSEEEDMTIWMSNDKNHIPIRIEANLLVGSIKIDLHAYCGLMYPISEIKK